LGEIIPKNNKWKRWPETTDARGIYFPLCEPRKIDEGAYLHRSVIDRMETGYAPVNLPKKFDVAETRPLPGS
jgi:hypothetical protein